MNKNLSENDGNYDSKLIVIVIQYDGKLREGDGKSSQHDGRFRDHDS